MYKIGTWVKRVEMRTAAMEIGTVDQVVDFDGIYLTLRRAGYGWDPSLFAITEEPKEERVRKLLNAIDNAS